MVHLVVAETPHMAQEQTSTCTVLDAVLDQLNQHNQPSSTAPRASKSGASTGRNATQPGTNQQETQSNTPAASCVVYEGDLTAAAAAGILSGQLVLDGLPVCCCMAGPCLPQWGFIAGRLAIDQKIVCLNSELK